MSCMEMWEDVNRECIQIEVVRKNAKMVLTVDNERWIKLGKHISVDGSKESWIISKIYPRTFIKKTRIDLFDTRYRRYKE